MSTNSGILSKKRKKALKIAGLVILLLIIMRGCGFFGPFAPDRICDNLVAEDLIEPSQCAADKVYTTFMPHYFHVGETTFDFVSAGMKGFEQTQYHEDYRCDKEQHHIFVEYRTGTTEYVSLRFCANILVGIGYHG